MHTINILIPMAGLGHRFAQHGYKLPKPLISINGKPMILKALESLEIENAKYLFVISKNSFTTKIKEVIKSFTDHYEIIEIDFITEGPSCSALLFEKEIDNEQELIIANCDQIMEWNPDIFLLNARQYHGCVVTYHETTDKNSYAKINKKGLVVEIKEKEVISNISLNGIHYWKQGRYFVDSVKKMIANDDRAPNGEFYIGPSYNYMIKDNLSVGIYHIPNQQHHAVGVPDDLKKYLKYENSEN